MRPPTLCVQEEAALTVKVAAKGDDSARYCWYSRALNMYENYPFWHTFFTRLGFGHFDRIRPPQKTYDKRIESMPSGIGVLSASFPTGTS